MPFSLVRIGLKDPVSFSFQCLVYCFEILVKNSIFLETLLSISKSEAGGVLSNVLKISRN